MNNFKLLIGQLLHIFTVFTNYIRELLTEKNLVCDSFDNKRRLAETKYYKDMSHYKRESREYMF